MTRLMMIAAASLLTLVLTGCGEDKPAQPAATTTVVTTPADATTTTTVPADAQKPANHQ